MPGLNILSLWVLTVRALSQEFGGTQFRPQHPPNKNHSLAFYRNHTTFLPIKSPGFVFHILKSSKCLVSSSPLISLCQDPFLSNRWAGLTDSCERSWGVALDWQTAVRGPGEWLLLTVQVLLSKPLFFRLYLLWKLGTWIQVRLRFDPFSETMSSTGTKWLTLFFVVCFFAFVLFCFFDDCNCWCQDPNLQISFC